MQQSRMRELNIKKIFKERLDLMRAIKYQDENYINNLTTINFNINQSHPAFGNPLRTAVKVGNYKIFKKLIELGADIHQVPASEKPLIYEAVESGNHDIIKYLIKNGIDINASWKMSRFDTLTALHYAADFGKKDVVTLLLENNANVNCKSMKGTTPLALAILSNNYDAMDALLNYSPDLFCPLADNNKTVTNFHLAIPLNQWNILYDCLFRFADMIDADNTTNLFTFFQSQLLLHHTLRMYRCDVDIISYLVDVGVDVNAVDSDNKLAIEFEFGLQYHPRSISIIKHHIVKLIAAGFYVCDRNIESVSTKEFDDYLVKCRSEVESMKINKIQSSNVTFMDVLQKDIFYLANHMKFVDLVSILDRKPSDPIFPEYPIYDHMLFYKLLRVFKRVSYIKESEEIIYNIFDELQLPDTFVRELYFCLTNNDLEKIIKPSHEKKTTYSMKFQRRKPNPVQSSGETQ